MTEAFAWASGLFEGEGCISINKGRPVLSLQSTDEDVVRRFAMIVRRGRVNGPYPPGPRGNKSRWMWGVDAWEDVEPLLNRLMPYLGARRSEKARATLAMPPNLKYASKERRKRYGEG